MLLNKRILGLLALCSVSGGTWADGTWVNCDRTSGYYQYFATTTVEVGKDAAVGDLLGPWLSAGNPTAWTCTPLSGSQNGTIQMAVQGYPPYGYQSYYLNVDGQSYRVYNTAVKAGLGYIARWRYTVNGQTSDWVALTVNNGVYQTPPQLFTVSYNNGTKFSTGVDVQIRFVKTATTLTAGTTAVFDPMYMRHYQTNGSTNSTGGGTYMIAEFLAGGLNISTTGGTCTTPNVTVTLPDVSASEFTGPGYTTARKDFTLNFNKCPAGLASISYTLTPATAILDSAKGVVALDTSSTATGVGIQLLSEDSIPVTYNSAYLLKDYDSSVKNANYSVPMTAGLYQTGATVTPGAANSSVSFTLSYK